MPQAFSAYIRRDPFSQRSQVDRVHASAVGQVQRMRGRRAHRDAGSHHADARECRGVGVDASPGRHDVVRTRRGQATERHIMHMVLGERLPGISFDVMMLFERPSRAGDAVLELHSLAQLVHGEMVAAHDPARLADTRQAVRAHPRLAKRLRKLAP